MTRININEAKTHLSRYAKQVKAGETIILCDRNKPFAEIRPLPRSSSKNRRKLGLMAGSVEFDDLFFESDKEIEEEFLNSTLYPSQSAAGSSPEKE